jgi:uncharacterized protein YdaU (DUF1376 family)
MSQILEDTDEEVSSKFRQDEDGKWFNPRADREILKREEGAIWRAENGRKGGLAKARNKQNSSKDPSKTTSENLARALENEDEITNSNTIETNSPSHIFSKESIIPNYNSLEDLYNDLN